MTTNRLSRAERAKKYTRVANKVSLYEVDINERDRKYSYPSSNFMPCVFFLKYLARKPSSASAAKNPNALKLNLPDTVIMSDGDLPPMWLYTSPSGYVTRNDTFTQQSITSKFQGKYPAIIKKVNSIIPTRMANTNVKKPTFKTGQLSNEAEVISAENLEPIVSNLFKEKQTQLVVLQKFIPAKLSRPFVCRTVWRDNRPPLAWVISRQKDQLDSPESAIVQVSELNSCSIVETSSGQFLDETIVFVADIARYFHTAIQVIFKEIVADFVRDLHGRWWMINVKGFVVESIPNSIALKAITNYGDNGVDVPISPFAGIANRVEQYCRMKRCKYCEDAFPSHTLTKRLSLKQIIQADRHLQHRGYTFSWLSRTDLKHIDAPMLFHTHPVCEDCFLLYTEIAKLIESEVVIARLQGVDVTEDSAISLASSTQLNGFYKPFNAVNMSCVNNFSNNPKAKEMPLNWSFDIEPETEIQVNNNNLSTPGKDGTCKSIRYRFMVLLNEVCDVPYEREPNTIAYQYSVRFSFLGVEEKYPIDIQKAVQSRINPDDFSVKMNKLRVLYAFANKRSDLNQFMKEQECVQLDLLCGSSCIGSAKLELADFLNHNVTRKDYKKIFTGSKLPLLKWGVYVTLGLTTSGEIDTKRIPLRSHVPGIMVPNREYYTCEPLHPDWMQSIKNRPNIEGETLKSISRRQRAISLAQDNKKAIEEDLDCSEMLQKSFYSVNISSQFIFPNDTNEVTRKSVRSLDVQKLLKPHNKSTVADETMLSKTSSIFDGHRSKKRNTSTERPWTSDRKKEPSRFEIQTELSFSQMLTAEQSTLNMTSKSMLNSFKKDKTAKQTSRSQSTTRNPRNTRGFSASSQKKSPESSFTLRSSLNTSILDPRKTLESLLQDEICAYIGKI